MQVFSDGALKLFEALVVAVLEPLSTRQALESRKIGGLDRTLANIRLAHGLGSSCERLFPTTLHLAT